MELHTEGRATIRKTANNFACLSVPELNDTIVASREEPGTVIIETDVPDGFRVTHVRTNALSVRLDVPDLACAIMTGTEHQVASLREEFHSLDSFIMATPCVEPLFGDKAIVFLLSEVTRSLHKAFDRSRI